MNLHDEIEKLAQQLYELSGRAEGRDLHNWLEAESIVLPRHREHEHHGIETAG